MRTTRYSKIAQEPLPEPTAAELMKEAEQEAAVFGQAGNVAVVQRGCMSARIDSSNCPRPSSQRSGGRDQGTGGAAVHGSDRGKLR